MTTGTQPPNASSPRLVLTYGVHGSASTWAFNVARDLMEAAFGADTVTALFVGLGTNLADQPHVADHHVVAKIHGEGVTPALESFAWHKAARVVVTIRDPRDATASLMQRFAVPIGPAAGSVALDYRHAARWAAGGCPTLRYEDGFFADSGTVARLARHLGIEVSPAVSERIFTAYSTDAVRAFAAGVASQPQDELFGYGTALLVDRRTLITHRHIGDGRAGKWRDFFDADSRAQLTRYFAPCLARFGYAEA